MSNEYTDPRIRLTDDIPVSFKENLKEILVIDEHFKIYQPDIKHDGIVKVELCLVRKDQYVETELTTNDGELVPSPTLPTAFLVDETNFQDIGGGLQTFERHYATFPSTWYDFKEVTYRTTYWGAINWRTWGGNTKSWHREKKCVSKSDSLLYSR